MAGRAARAALLLLLTGATLAAAAAPRRARPATSAAPCSSISSAAVPPGGSGSNATAKHAAAFDERFELPIESQLTAAGMGPRLTFKNAQVYTTPHVASSECAAATSPCAAANLLTNWWDGASPKERSYLMITFSHDGYPSRNFSEGDGPAYQCKFVTKWKGLGASSIKFVDSELTNIVLMNAGNNVFVNYRGTWTPAQSENNRREWGKVPGPLAGQVHKGWLRSLDETWAEVETVLRTDFSCAGECLLHVSGHSRGGGLAALAAARLPASIGRVGGVFTYGGVRPGNAEFQDAFNAKFGAITFNWWNRQDWVPRQPFINKQSPRLRITDAACPSLSLPTTSPCYLAANATVNRKGQEVHEEICAKGARNPVGDADHWVGNYLKNVRACTSPVALSEACIAAL